MYTDHDRISYLYETEISRYEPDALAKAAARAVERATRNIGPSDLGYAFRVIDNSYSYVSDPEYDAYSVTTKLEIIAFPIVKLTPTGFRIRRSGADENPETRMVSGAWTKQWASRTPEAALRSYIARRKRQASIYEARAATARELAVRAEYLLKDCELEMNL
jgi:hypothetical protein